MEVPNPVEVPRRKFLEPKRCIFDEKDLEEFKKSPACAEIFEFVKGCAASVARKKNSDEVVVHEIVRETVVFLDSLYAMVDEIPPLKQPMRFGNKAFRIWQSRLGEKISDYLERILPREMIEEGAKEELMPYLSGAFGDATRIDYGTGHELSFILHFYCLFKIHLITEIDLPAVVLRAFVQYIKVMRKLQTTYLLEPAGTHGVWGLDDYHCLTFVFGAAQLIGHESIEPSSIHEESVLSLESPDYLYLEGIAFIKQIKSAAPFAETSPMLNDISQMSGGWPKVLAGLLRLFQGEVLGKRPVVQHLRFGSILHCTWAPSSTGDARIPSKIGFDSVATKAPWAK